MRFFKFQPRDKVRYIAEDETHLLNQVGVVRTVRVLQNPETGEIYGHVTVDFPDETVTCHSNRLKHLREPAICDIATMLEKVHQQCLKCNPDPASCNKITCPLHCFRMGIDPSKGVIK